jgi:small-conductance mechanosensitive channel
MDVRVHVQCVFVCMDVRVHVQCVLVCMDVRVHVQCVLVCMDVGVFVFMCACACVSKHLNTHAFKYSLTYSHNKRKKIFYFQGIDLINVKKYIVNSFLGILLYYTYQNIFI